MKIYNFVIGVRYFDESNTLSGATLSRPVQSNELISDRVVALGRKELIAAGISQP